MTGKTRDYGGIRRWQVSFPEGIQYVPDDQLEEVTEGGDDPLDLLHRGRFGDGLVLRRTITHARLTGRLADVIYSMDTTGTDFYAHQFKPVVKLMNSAGRGLLIADEVGLGKTIEAGLIWTELRSRFDFRRLLVLCPAVLREKWQRELRKRFGVDADILDADGTLARLQRADEEGYTAQFAIVASLQGLRPHRGWDEYGDDESTRASSRLARFLDGRSQNDPLVDLCIIDEAHYLRNRETMTSVLGRLVRAVADYIVLLSATPIHLRSDDLYGLLNLVDEDTFSRRHSFDEILQANKPLVRAREIVLRGANVEDTVTKLRTELLCARRHPLLRSSHQLRALIDEEVWSSDIGQHGVVARLAERLERVNLLGHVVTRTRKRDVEERRVVRLVEAPVIHLSPPERAFYDAVTDLVREYCRKRGTHEGFLQVTPQRQMCSSMPAALRSWQRGSTVETGNVLEGPEDDERPLRSELVARAQELGNLGELWQNDSKYAHLRQHLRSLLEGDREVKVVVFSYFRPTLAYLHERLRQDGIRSIPLHGGTSDKDETVLGFHESPDHRVLLSSEVGSEGIDLQFARVVINYDLPWNPMRVEQRIGRIDRLGQRADKIHVRNLFYAETIDARIYKRLFDRLKIFEGALGTLEPVLGDMVQALMKDLFSKHLTPEEEAERIDQTRRALAQRQHLEEKLEQEAAHLTAYGDYILNQVKAARDLHRSISAEDLRSYVIDFVSLHYRGSEFRQVGDDPMRFDVSLSNNSRQDLGTYIKRQRIGGSTRLVQDSVNRVPCRFKNTAVPDLRGREEVISQFHPLVRFVADRLNEPEQQNRPAVAVRVSAAESGIELRPGLYVFSVQRWSVRGLRDMERLHYAAAFLHADSAAEVVAPEVAERLIVTAAGKGVGWPGVRGVVGLDNLVEAVAERCIAASDRAFDRYVDDRRAENDDRARVQEQILDERHQRERGVLERVLQEHRVRGRHRLVPATEGRLRALEARVERLRNGIAQRRSLQSSNATVCVGIIEVDDAQTNAEQTEDTVAGSDA